MKETNLMSLEQYRKSVRSKKTTEIPDFVWTEAGIPVPEREYRFCKRKWRLDFAWPDNNMVGVEIQGLTQKGGAHQKFAGYLRDCEKHNWLIEHGWKLLIYVPKHIDFEQIERVVNYRMRPWR